jgi:hypothetical protein
MQSITQSIDCPVFDQLNNKSAEKQLTVLRNEV